MEVPAKLGLTISGEGARREISLTSAQLRALANGGKEAAAVMRELNGELAGGGGSGGPASGGGGSPPERIDRITQAISRMRVAASQHADLGFRDQIADLDPFNTKIQQGTRFTTRFTESIDKMRASSRNRIDLGLVKQIEQLDPFQKKLDQIPGSAHATRLSLGRLGNQFANLAGSIAGVHPIIGNLLGVFGHFAVGGLITTSVVAGLAVLMVAWSKFTEKIREQAIEQERLIKAGTAAQSLRALGPGGESAATATAAGEQLADIKQKRDELDGIFNRIFKSGYILPGQNEQEKARLDRERGLIELLQKRVLLENELARVRSFAESVKAPFDFAQARGDSLSQFYDDAAAAEVKLTELAKSGALDVKNTARAALLDILRIIDNQKLVKLGLQEQPSKLLGLPSDVFMGAARQRAADVGGAITLGASRGRQVSDFSDEIEKLGDVLGRAANQAKSLSLKTALESMLDDLRHFSDALRLESATDKEAVAKAIRDRAVTTVGTGAIAGERTQFNYSAQLAMREAALKLPAAFDVDREAAVRHGETMRSLTQELDVSLSAYKSVDNAVGSFKEGLLSAANDFMSMVSPAMLGKGLLGGVTDTITGFIKGTIEKGSEFIRKSIFGSTSEQRQAAHAAQIAQQQLALTLDGVRAALAGDSLGASLAGARQALIGLLEQINAALPGKGNEAERNARRAEAQQLERQQEAQIRADEARRRREQKEDLDVRMLRARGDDLAADALALRQQQEREYADALRDGADAAYLAALTQVQAAEKTKAAMQSLQDAVRGGPSGFRLEDYGLGQAYFGPRGGGMTPPLPTPVNPFVPGGSTRPPTAGLTMQINEGAIVIHARPGETDTELATRLVHGLRQLGAGIGGPNVAPSDVLNSVA